MFNIKCGIYRSLICLKGKKNMLQRNQSLQSIDQQLFLFDSVEHTMKHYDHDPPQPIGMVCTVVVVVVVRGVYKYPYPKYPKSVSENIQNFGYPNFRISVFSDSDSDTDSDFVTFRIFRISDIRYPKSFFFLLYLLF